MGAEGQGGEQVNIQRTTDNGIQTPTDVSATQLLHLRLRDHGRRRGRRILRTKDQLDIWHKIFSFMYAREGAPMKSRNMVV